MDSSDEEKDLEIQYLLSSKEVTLDHPNIQYVDQYYKNIVFGFMHKLLTKLEKENDFNNIIPEIVYALILLFYYEREYFTQYGQHMEITSSDIGKQKLDIVSFNPNKVADHNYAFAGWNSPRAVDSDHNTAYGNIWIDTKKFPNVLYQWILSINMKKEPDTSNPAEDEEGASCIIGVHSSPGTFDVNHNAYKGTEAYSMCYARQLIANLEENEYGILSHWDKHPEIDALITNDGLYAELSDDYDVDIGFGVHKIHMILNTREESLRFIDDEKDLGNAFTEMCLKDKLRLAVCINKNVTVQILDFKMHSVK